MPYKETVRRTFNINNYESLTYEGYAEHDNAEVAHLLAVYNLLNKVSESMLIIFDNRHQFSANSDHDATTYNMILEEIKVVKVKLEQINTKALNAEH